MNTTENIWLLSSICHICNLYTVLHVVIKKITFKADLLLKAVIKGCCPSEIRLPGQLASHPTIMM